MEKFKLSIWAGGKEKFRVSYLELLITLTAISKVERV